MDHKQLWAKTRDDLVLAVTSLGFDASLGEAAARYLGSPRAMERMISYLRNVEPKKEELVIDEMLSIRSEIDAWKLKKEAERANAAYNAVLYYGLGEEDVQP